MIVFKYFLFFIFIISKCTVLGQYAISRHLTVNDGLPSSNVYCLAQDRKGFMWIGTEAGLVRYDGTNFRIFTTQDGLPDNEVLGLSVNRNSGRIWVTTYSKWVCFYENGIFRTQKSDSLLKKINSEKGEFLHPNSWNQNSEYLFSGTTLYRYNESGVSKYKINDSNITGVREWNDSMYDICSTVAKLYFYNIHMFKNKIEIDKISIPIPSNSEANHGSFWADSILILAYRNELMFFAKKNDGKYDLKKKFVLDINIPTSNVLKDKNSFWISKVGDGVYFIDSLTADKCRKVWSGNVNNICLSKDGDLWIATKDDGVYVLKKKVGKYYNSSNGIIHDNVTAIALQDSKIYLGNSFGDLYSISDDQIRKVVENNTLVREKVRVIVATDREVYYISDGSFYKYDPGHSSVSEIRLSSASPKTLVYAPRFGGLLGGYLNGIFKFKGSLSEVNLYKRIVSIAEHPDGRVICGTIDGIFWLNDTSLTSVDGTDIRLQARVYSLCYTVDSLLWIGTASDGLVVYDGKKILTRIESTAYPSFTGRICRKVIAGRPGEVWVATNYGVNKVSYHYHGSLVIDNITPLNTTDGILSDDVNDIAVRDNQLYVACAKGLNVIDLHDMERPVPTPIYILSLNIGGIDSAIHDVPYSLSYQQNNLRIQYTGISIHSGGYIRYQYRLLGAGTEWQTTTNTSVEFRSLSPNTYTFEVAVLDKFGNRSKDEARVRFTIRPAFYQSIWFWVAIFIFALAIGFYLIRAQFGRQRIRYEKEQQLNTKIIELEQQALKAQMNPHFIFNCLASIQHFVNKEDGDSANRYLSNFAKLIRKTLDLSGEQYISLDKEIAYLENYVQMEKLRFQDKFEYKITVDESIDEYAIMIPPMLIQPIVENAIRHGLRYKENNDGILRISFTLAENSLICKIEDNGIGIKRSRELKTSMHVEYQSKGTKLTESRIQAINMLNEKKIKMTVTDKYDENKNATGTLVTIIWEQ